MNNGIPPGVGSSSHPAGLGRLTNSTATWLLARYLRRADRLSGSKRAHFLRRASRGALVGIGTSVLCACGSVLICLLCGYSYATYPASPPEYPASMWVFFGMASALVCFFHVFLGLVCLDCRRRLQPFVTAPE